MRKQRKKDDAIDPEVLDKEDESPSGTAKSSGKLFDDPSDSKSSESLVHVSSLSAYLSGVGRYSLLTRDEEYDLAVKLHENNDQDAAAKLITSNLRLVVKIAMDYQRAFINLMDLIQEGNIGLMIAVSKFDPFKGVKLSSYAAWWIKAYIYRYILNNWRMVKIGTTQAQRKLFFNLKKEKERLEAQGFSPTTKLLAERLEVSEKDVIEMDKRLSRNELSLESPLTADSTTTMGDMTPSTEVLQDEALVGEQLDAIYRKAMLNFKDTLSGKELDIYQNRMLGDPPQTLQDIGDRYGITRERVRQIETRVLKKLKEFFRENHIESPY